MVLTVVLTEEQIKNSRFGNTAESGGLIDIGESDYVSYKRRSTALDVMVMPPFGKELNNNVMKSQNINTITKIMVVISLIALILIIIKMKKIKSKKM